MSTEKYDLAVIGAGPAGAFAAAEAAKAGIKTMILEQKSFPRPKICGGFISFRALSLLPADFSLPPETAEPVKRLSIIKKDKSYSYQSEKLLGYLVQRSSFDQLMAAYASSKGALLAEEVSLKKIEVINEKIDPGYRFILHFLAGQKMITVKTRFLIAADGALGRCSALGGIDRRIRTRICGWGLTETLTNQAEQNPEPENPAQLNIYPLPFKGGMGWAFQSRAWTNRGIGGFAGRKKLIRVYRQLFAGREKTKLQSWPLPFLGPLSRVAKGNLILIGDAAGLVEPFSGEGLYNSFKSALLAVWAISDALKTGNPAAIHYNRSFARHFRRYFAATLAGTVILHAQTIFFPATVPKKIAGLIENRLWFNDQNPDLR